MATMTFTAKVRKDGSLAIPKRTREQLGTFIGDSVEVSIHTNLVRAEGEQGRNPLYDIIGIAQGGRPDGAENHDEHLYGREGDQTPRTT